MSGQEVFGLIVFVGIVYGVYKYLAKKTSEKKKEEVARRAKVLKGSKK